MVSYGYGDIERGKSATGQQRTESTVFLLKPCGNNQQTGACGEAQNRSRHFVDPLVINGVFHKQADTDNQHEDADFAEQVSADKLFVVYLFHWLRSGRNSRSSRHR